MIQDTIESIEMVEEMCSGFFPYPAGDAVIRAAIPIRRTAGSLGNYLKAEVVGKHIEPYTPLTYEETHRIQEEIA